MRDRAEIAYEAFMSACGVTANLRKCPDFEQSAWQAVADALDAESEDSARKFAEAAIDYLSGQNYQGEPILHAIVSCDYVSREHMITAVAKAIDAARKVE